MISDEELVRRATEVINPRKISPSVEVGGVGSALVTDKGNVYVGVCIDTGSSLGFCAEHNAVGNMITHGENKIVSIVAVDWDKKIIAPCGRCRELIYQVDVANTETRVLLNNGRAVRLKELLPER